jgi:hypothetical protein
MGGDIDGFVIGLDASLTFWSLRRSFWAFW